MNPSDLLEIPGDKLVGVYAPKNSVVGAKFIIYALSGYGNEIRYLPHRSIQFFKLDQSTLDDYDQITNIAIIRELAHAHNLLINNLYETSPQLFRQVTNNGLVTDYLIDLDGSPLVNNKSDK